MQSLMQYYTGVGSRETPEDILSIMRKLGCKLAQNGYVLRSGAAKGADTAFEDGASKVPSVSTEIYVPWKGYNGNVDGIYITSKELLKQAEEIASKIHPNWNVCSRGAKSMHTRNVFQVLGSDLETPSKFLICWSKPNRDSVSGGTRTAWEIAKKNSIQCFNLYEQEHLDRINNYFRL